MLIGEDDPNSAWGDATTSNALGAAINSGQMPHRSLALYARWWQLEAWLRDLVYVELRARHGIQWFDEALVGKVRQDADAAFSHMAGVDGDNLLTYLDYSQLTQLIERNWMMFEPSLINQRSWSGRQPELKQIRHRIGHVRRPHADDLNRLEQTLRDLERRAFIATASYNDRRQPDIETDDDPVTKGWILGEHSSAQRLIDHAYNNYETTFLLRHSRRPWATWPTSLSGASGILWHVDFLMRGRILDVRRFWRESRYSAFRPYLVHMIIDDPRRVSFTFSAKDDAGRVSDAVGAVFDAVLTSSRAGTLKFVDTRAEMESWSTGVRDLDFRVLSRSPWGYVNEDTLPISIFDSGGGVDDCPEW